MKNKNRLHKSALFKNFCEIEEMLCRVNNKCACKVEEKLREKKFKDKNRQG